MTRHDVIIDILLTNYRFIVAESGQVWKLVTD